MKYLLSAFLLLFAAPCGFADSWTPATPRTASSPRGEHLLRSILPKRLDEKGDQWSKMLLIVYRLDTASQDYRETCRFTVEDYPIEFFINDAGDRIVTMDQWFGIGQGPSVVSVRDGKGRELKKWALKDFYDRKKIGQLSESTASVYWRGDAAWMGDQKGILIAKPTLFRKKNVELDDYLLDVRKLTIKKWVYLNLEE